MLTCLFLEQEKKIIKILILDVVCRMQETCKIRFGLGDQDI